MELADTEGEERQQVATAVGCPAETVRSMKQNTLQYSCTDYFYMHVLPMTALGTGREG